MNQQKFTQKSLEAIGEAQNLAIQNQNAQIKTRKSPRIWPKTGKAKSLRNAAMFIKKSFQLSKKIEKTVKTPFTGIFLLFISEVPFVF